MPPSSRPTAVVVGAGIAGLTAAYALSHTHHVVLLEADTRLGGHAHTHRIATAAGELAIDSGFIVHNQRTYPTFVRLLRELGVATIATEMSMSVTSSPSSPKYCTRLKVNES